MTMDALKSAILAFQFAKPISETITHLIQYKVSEIQFWPANWTTVRSVKISSISIPSHQTIQEITMGRHRVD